LDELTIPEDVDVTATHRLASVLTVTDGPQKAHWDRVEREPARARREAEQFHREQRIRQAKLDKERRREYNRTHPWGHRWMDLSSRSGPR
jgi:hypothetical protein